MRTVYTSHQARGTVVPSGERARRMAGKRKIERKIERKKSTSSNQICEAQAYWNLIQILAK